MSDEQARFAAWCAEGRGGLAPPSEDARAVLEELRAKGDVDVSTIVTRRSSLPKDDAREIWLAVFAEVSAAFERAEGGEALSGPRMQRYVAWALQPSDWEVKAHASAPETSKTKAKKAAKAEREEDECATADSDEDKAEEEMVTKVSSVCRADMKEQGASRPEQLSRVYLSVMMGRKCGAGEHSGLSYGSHWSMAKGLKQVAKNPTGLGQKTMPQLLEAAKKTGDVMPLDKFVNKVAESFMSDPADTFWVQAGSRLLKRWNRAKTVCSSTLATAWYFDQYWEEYPGRGIPEIIDHDLLREADRLAAHMGEAPRSKFTVPSGTGSSVSSLGSASAWSVPFSGLSSASEAHQRQESVTDDLLSSLLTKMTEQSAQLSTLSAKMATLDAGRARDEGEPLCYYCRQKGHLAEDCPKLKAKEERLKTEAEKSSKK